MNRYIDIFSKINSLSHRSHQTISHKKQYPTEIYQPRIATKTSLRDKTPTKSRKPHRNRTPTHKVHNENFIRR